MSSNSTPDTPTEELIESLSKKLALNYLANSFNRAESASTEVNHIFKKAAPVIFKKNAFDDKEGIDNQKIRNVLIIGAGAIYNSFKGVPMSNGIIQHMMDNKLKFIKEFDLKSDAEKITALKSETDFKHKKILEEYQNLLMLTGKINKETKKKELNFENLLYLLSKFMTEEDLRNEIKNIVGFNNANNLFYEIVAHLFKHSFIDVIINFNFEEVLDNIIREELGTGNYYSIISDGHTIKRETLFVEGRIKFPVYIKPHGTFSHSSTLRFTNQHYIDSPPDIKLMLTEIFSPNKDEKLNLNIICVGFKLFESIEFNSILKSTINKVTNPQFYIISNTAERKGQYEAIKENIYSEKKANKNLKVFTCSLKEYEKTIGSDNISPSLGVLFSRIFRKTSEKFNRGFTPRSIAKHELYSYFLYSKKNWLDAKISTGNDCYYNSNRYFKDKILVEIAFTFVRNLGLINIMDFIKGRAGIYLESYNNKCRSENEANIETIYSLISEFSLNGRDSKNIGAEGEYQYSKNFFKLPIIKSNDELDSIRKEIGLRFSKCKDFLEKLEPFLQDKVDEKFTLGETALLYLLRSDKLSEDCRNNLIANAECVVRSGAASHDEKSGFIPELFRLFQKSPNQNFFFIRNRINNKQYHYWESFSKNRLLQTNLSISYHFHKLFMDNRWNTLLAVLESGMVIKDCLKEKFETFKSDNQNYIEVFFNWFIKKRILITVSYQVAVELLNLNAIDRNKQVPDPDNLCTIFDLEYRFKNYLIDEIFESEKKHITKAQTDIFFSNLGIVFLPYWEHNHHVSLFLKLNTKGILRKDDKYHKMTLKALQKDTTLSVIAFGGFHMYRKGNSSAINPIHIKFDNDDRKIVTRDFEKLLILYFLNVCRAIMFQRQISPELHFNFNFTPNQITTYKDWSTEQFYKEMVDFMKNVKKFESTDNLKPFYSFGKKSDLIDISEMKKSVLDKVKNSKEFSDETIDKLEKLLVDI